VKKTRAEIRFKQTTRYWEQYIEEYVEEADIEGVDDVAEQRANRLAEVEMRRAKALEREVAPISTVKMEQIVELLRSHRVKDIFCVAVNPSQFPFHHVLICSPYNARHGRALQIHVRRWIKENFYYSNEKNFHPCYDRSKTERSGWYTVDFGGKCVLHIIDDGIRQRYDLERFYATGGGGGDEFGADDNDLVVGSQREEELTAQLGIGGDNEFSAGIEDAQMTRKKRPTYRTSTTLWQQPQQNNDAKK